MVARHNSSMGCSVHVPCIATKNVDLRVLAATSHWDDLLQFLMYSISFSTCHMRQCVHSSHCETYLELEVRDRLVLHRNTSVAIGPY